MAKIILVSYLNYRQLNYGPYGNIKRVAFSFFKAISFMGTRHDRKYINSVRPILTDDKIKHIESSVSYTLKLAGCDKLIIANHCKREVNTYTRPLIFKYTKYIKRLLTDKEIEEYAIGFNVECFDHKALFKPVIIPKDDEGAGDITIMVGDEPPIVISPLSPKRIMTAEDKLELMRNYIIGVNRLNRETMLKILE